MGPPFSTPRIWLEPDHVFAVFRARDEFAATVSAFRDIALTCLDKALLGAVCKLEGSLPADTSGLRWGLAVLADEWTGSQMRLAFLCSGHASANACQFAMALSRNRGIESATFSDMHKAVQWVIGPGALASELALRDKLFG